MHSITFDTDEAIRVDPRASSAALGTPRGSGSRATGCGSAKPHTRRLPDECRDASVRDIASETRSVDAQFFIPTENEWYKAAYHQPSAQGGDADNFWHYATASNGAPTVATADATGDINNPGANVVNYDSGADWNGQDGNVTTVGSAGPSSETFYGTSDQGGNVWEWTETREIIGSPPFFSFFRVLRGGSWADSGSDLTSEDGRMFGKFFPFDFRRFGFRVASPVSGSDVPTISQWGLAALALLILTAGRIMHRQRTARAA